jgi:beta-D-xylosidase 4
MRVRTLVVVLLGAPFFASAQNNPQIALSFCDPSSPTQRFYYDADNTSLVLADSGLCVDVLAYDVNPGAYVYSAPCHHEDRDPAHQNQNFSVPASAAPGTPLIQLMSSLAVDPSGFVAPGSLITLSPPSASSPTYLRPTASSSAPSGVGTLVHSASGLCWDTSGVVPRPPTPVQLHVCGDGPVEMAARQLWQVDAARSTLTLSVPTVYNETLCLTVGTFGAQPGEAVVMAAACPPPSVSPVPAVQSFTYDAAANGGSLQTPFAGMGWVVGAVPFSGPGTASPYYAGLPLTLLAAGGGGLGTVAFALNTTGTPAGTARLVHTASGLCLDAGALPNGHGCLLPSVRGLPFCDPTLSVDDRVADLLGRLTLAEKIALTGSAPDADTCDTIDTGIPRLGVPPVQWLVETNSMAASQCYGPTCATSFPSALNLAATFNASVWLEKGRTVGDEMRAMNSLGWHRADTQAGTDIGLNGEGPDINQPRDPRNGRIGELASEDPFLTGAYAAAYVQTSQVGEDPRYLRMSASIKHYSGYSLETNRFGSHGNFSLYDLWDSYLPPFEMAWVEGGATGAMCAYISLRITGNETTGAAGSSSQSPSSTLDSRVSAAGGFRDNGGYVPACANPYLLTTLVREYWGNPDAVIISDCGAVQNMAHANGYTVNDTFSAAAALNSGMDINSELILPQQLGLALQLNLTTVAALDAAVTRTLKIRFRTGMLDPLEMQVYTRYGIEKVGTPANLQAAYEGVAQGLVLVRNENGTLPLAPGRKLAVLGPLADQQYALMGDYYADAVCPGFLDATKSNYGCVPRINDTLAAANGAGGQVTTYQGVTMSGNDTTWGLALAAAADADAVVLALGTDQTIAGEGVDRNDIGLPGLQSDFALAVLAAAGAGKPVVIVIVSSFPVSFDALASAAPAVVLAYTPSLGAAGIAAALFGSNRWGRAVLSVYPHAYQDAVGLGDFGMTPVAGVNPGRSYRYYDGSAGPLLVRFGQGLTYSTFQVGCGVASSVGALAGPVRRRTHPQVRPALSTTLAVTCNVTNSAGPAGDEILMVFHRAGPDVVARINGSHPVPLSTLVGFTRISVGAGATVAGAQVVVDEDDALALVDDGGNSVLYAGTHYLDVWDGDSNNVTLVVEVPRERERVVVARGALMG